MSNKINQDKPYSWILSLALGIIFLYHGLNKNLDSFATNFKFPSLIAGLVILAEISGGLGFILGEFNNKEYFGHTITQWASLSVIPVLLGAIFLVHWKNGFNFSNNGFEYQFLLLMVAIYLYYSSTIQSTSSIFGPSSSGVEP